METMGTTTTSTSMESSITITVADNASKEILIKVGENS
jgi:hypothetical protein